MGGMLSLMGGAGPGQWPTADEVRNTLDLHVDVLNRLSDLLTIIARDDNPDHFEFDDGGQAAGGGPFTVKGFMVPVGKRVIVRRVLSTAPAGSGPLAIYASPAGSTDGGSLRHVVAAPQLAATDIVDGTVIKGGYVVTCVFNAAVAGTCTVRLEGSIMDDGPKTSHTL